MDGFHSEETKEDSIMTKSFIIKICPVIFPVLISAQTTFSDPMIIQETLTDGASSVYAADLDNDGDLDVMSGFCSGR